MNIPNVSQNRNLFYILLVLTLLGVGAIIFVNRYYYLFAGNSEQASGETVDVANVNIRNLNTKILEDKQFQSLQKMETTPDSLDKLEKGKRNPFLPN